MTETPRTDEARKTYKRWQEYARQYGHLPDAVEAAPLEADPFCIAEILERALVAEREARKRAEARVKEVNAENRVLKAELSESRFLAAEYRALWRVTYARAATEDGMNAAAVVTAPTREEAAPAIEAAHETDMTSASTPDGYVLVMDTGDFVGAWKSREIAEKLQNRGPMSKGEVVRAFVFIDDALSQEHPDA